MSLVTPPAPRNAWEKASLVIGNGFLVKPGKLGALKPLSALGELDFTRVGDTATRVNEAGFIEDVPANVPVVDFLGGIPRLRLQRQSTNLTLNSASTFPWTGTTVLPNAATSPRGTLTAYKLVEDSTTGFHQSRRATTLGGTVDGASYEVSVFVEANGRSKFALRDNNQNTSGNTVFDLANGTVVSGTGKIEDYGRGYYRCTIFPLRNFSTTSVVLLTMLNSSGEQVYAGDEASGLNVYGWMVSFGGGNYIETLGAAVTRGADVCKRLSIASLIGQDEGSIIVRSFVTIAPNLFNNAVLYLSDGTLNNYIRFEYQAFSGSHVLVASIVQDGVFVYEKVSSLSALAVNGRVTFGISYKSGSIEVFLNGAIMSGSSSGSQIFIPFNSLSKINIGSRPDDTNAFTDSIEEVVINKTKPSDTEMMMNTAL